MSNGPKCCAMEVCCEPLALRAKLPNYVAISAGVECTSDFEIAVCQVIDFMEKEGLVFAPSSFRRVVKDIVEMARKHGK